MGLHRTIRPPSECIDCFLKIDYLFVFHYLSLECAICVSKMDICGLRHKYYATDNLVFLHCPFLLFEILNRVESGRDWALFFLRKRNPESGQVCRPQFLGSDHMTILSRAC